MSTARPLVAAERAARAGRDGVMGSVRGWVVGWARKLWRRRAAANHPAAPRAAPPPQAPQPAVPVAAPPEPEEAAPPPAAEDAFAPFGRALGVEIPPELPLDAEC